MADRAVPDAFANDLTGVYATDPDYGANLIAIMRLYNLYRFDTQAGGQQKAANVTQAAGGDGVAHGRHGAGQRRHSRRRAGLVEHSRPGATRRHRGDPGRRRERGSRTARPRGPSRPPGRPRFTGARPHSRTTPAARQRVCPGQGASSERRPGPSPDRCAAARQERDGARQCPDPWPRRADRAAVPGQAPRDGGDGLLRHGESTAGPGRTAAPRRGRPGGHPVAAARRLRLDAVPGRPALFAGARGAARHAQRRLHGVRHEVASPLPVRHRPRSN